jgi:hypothetical protein
MTDMAPSAAARQPAGPTNRPMRWITAWTRAVVVPASRRADAATLGAVLIAAVAFGPTAMRPHDLTGLALANPAVGAVLAATWLLVFVPTARMIVRPPIGYLYSLPGDPRAARAVALAALLLLQLPWLVLWIAGEGARGGLVVLATTALAAAIACVLPRDANARRAVGDREQDGVGRRDRDLDWPALPRTYLAPPAQASVVVRRARPDTHPRSSPR